MEPQAYAGYVMSRTQWLDKAYGLIAEAESILKDPTELKEKFVKLEMTLSEVDCLKKALEKAQEGVNILKDHAPDAINDVYVIDKINAKIKRLTAPKPKPKPKKVPKKEIPVAEPEPKPPQSIGKPKKSKRRWE